jgi:PRTRC genetic system protein C
MTIQRLTRVFKKGPTRLLDPDPAMTPEQVLEHYTDLYPELANATVSEPEASTTELVYTFEKPIVKTKGNQQITLPQMCQKHQHLLTRQAGYGPEDPWQALLIASQIALFQAATADERTYRRIGGEIAKLPSIGCLACYKPDAFGEVVEAAKTKDLGAIKRLGESWVSAAKDLSIGIADHVRHQPSGEDWVVARVDGEHLWPAGWPRTRALLSDCLLVRKATDKERAEMSAALSRLPREDERHQGDA